MTEALDTAIARVRDDMFEANLEFLAQEAWFAGWAAVAEQPINKFDAFADFWDQARANIEHAAVFRQAQVTLRAPAEVSANDDRVEVIAAIFAQPFGAPNLLTDTPQEIAERIIAADLATQRILDLERQLAAMTLARDSAIGMAKDVTERCDLLAEKAQSFLAACAAYGESEADDVRCMLNYGEAKDDLAQTIISGKQS